MHDPTRHPAPDEPPRPVQPDRPAKDKPARDVKEGDFDESAAGEEDPGAGVDTLTPKR